MSREKAEKDRVAHRDDRCRLDLVGKDAHFPGDLPLHEVTDRPFLVGVAATHFPEAPAHHDEETIRRLAPSKQGLTARDVPPGQQSLDVGQHVLAQVAEQDAQYPDYLVAIEHREEDVPQVFGHLRVDGEVTVEPALFQPDEA